MAVTPRNEAETIISYDPVTKQWHYYSDVPAHNRKWQHVIEPERITVEDNGTISLLEGTVTGSVTISKKRQMTEEQRQAAVERLAASRSNAA
ncbi:hypothetical protein P7G87_00330 [Enterococcus asini]|uniref:hypothetical protein n=1 Tax=Enterococcus asini TaxID=57732 RepID=UPI002891A345|nr:hypothetical protein [Enterococcus asini]MDT2783133.1 hypothetical protein [Enterococcus asini]